MSKSIAPALVVPDDIIEYDLNSEPCNANGRGSFLERFIHGEIYKARPDINSVVHSHSPSVIPFGLVPTDMKAMFHNAAFLAAGVPVFDIADKFGDTDMLVCDCVKGEALAEVLKDKDVALMRAHGSVACGPTLQTAVFRAVYTEVNARIQHFAPKASLQMCRTRPQVCAHGIFGALRFATRLIGKLELINGCSRAEKKTACRLYSDAGIV